MSAGEHPEGQPGTRIERSMVLVASGEVVACFCYDDGTVTIRKKDGTVLTVGQHEVRSIERLNQPPA